jgi:hypothetical protein
MQEKAKNRDGNNIYMCIRVVWDRFSEDDDGELTKRNNVEVKDTSD